MYRFEEVRVDDDSLQKAAALSSDVFQRPDLFSKEYIKWQYADNPDGAIVGFNAFRENELGAHYVAQPFDATRNGEKTRGLLSLNTATAEGHRGKSLFTQLADKTYEVARAKGYDFVIGVANQNSFNGFVKKLGFQLVGQFNVMLGLGSLPQPKFKMERSYERCWNSETLLWRSKNPSNFYQIISDSERTAVYSKTKYPLIKACLGTFSKDDLAIETTASSKDPFVKMWMGMDCRVDFAGHTYFNIPPKFRPAPLYLVYKDLSGNYPQLNSDEVVFQAIDFDAY